MSVQSEEKAITIVKPIASIDAIVEQWTQFEELKAKLLKEDDYQDIRIRGKLKKYIKRSGFRKIALAFGISDELVSETRIDREDEEGSFAWRIIVRVTAPNGRSCIGVGACDSRERGFAHLEHDIYATAHTRAKTRAISDMVAGGVVSAEELEPTLPSEEQRTSEERSPVPIPGPAPTPDLPLSITWTVLAESVPIFANSRPYGSFRTRYLEKWKEEDGIDYEEKLVGDNVVGIRISLLEDTKKKQLTDYLEWVIKTLHDGPPLRPDDIAITIVEVLT